MILIVATLLQLQCGLQSFENGSLVYGSVVYQAAGEQQPSFVFFEGLQDQSNSSMTLCLQLKEKMDNGQSATLVVSPNEKRLLGLQ